MCMLPQDIPRLTLTRSAHPYLPPSFRLLHGAAKGLAHIHSCGKVHGDIKPSNIVLVLDKGNSNTITFTAKIADFGFTVGEKTTRIFLVSGDFLTFLIATVHCWHELFTRIRDVVLPTTPS